LVDPKKHIVFFWSGRSLSWLRYLTIYSFRVLNPEWKISLYLCHTSLVTTWLDHNRLDFSEYEGEDYLPRLQFLGVDVQQWELPPEICSATPPHACDLFEWQWLSENVGYYADMDILWVRPMKVPDSDAAIVYGKQFSIGLVWSGVAPNPMFRDIYQESLRTYTPAVYQSAGVVPIYQLLGHSGPEVDLSIPWFERLREKYPTVSKLPFPMIHPWDHEQLEAMYDELHTEVPTDCVGIHWYGAAPRSQTFNQEYGPRTQQDNTLSHFARRVA